MRKKVPRKNCRNCGKLCSRPEKVYCNNTCQKAYEGAQLVAAWLAGKDKGWTGPGIIKPFVRRYMLARANNRCEKCNWGERHPITGRVMLEVHHKDGNYENTTVDNLGVLCPNHHSLTPNYKNCNAGRGRACRRTKG